MTFTELIEYGKETLGQTEDEAELHAAYIQEKQEAIKQVEQQALCLDSIEAEEDLESTTKKNNK
jgi:hypothetical protein